MCSIDDGERPDVYRASTHRAAKQHKCEECSRAIEIGETYGYVFMVYEGRGWTFRTCQHCRVGQQWLSINCGGWMSAGLDDEMWEHIHEYPSVKFGLYRIVTGIRRGWKRFDCMGLMPVQPLPRTILEDAA